MYGHGRCAARSREIPEQAQLGAAEAGQAAHVELQEDVPVETRLWIGLYRQHRVGAEVLIRGRPIANVTIRARHERQIAAGRHLGRTSVAAFRDAEVIEAHLLVPQNARAVQAAVDTPLRAGESGT